MMVTRRRVSGVVLVGLVGLVGLTGCVGINPDWDGPATEGWMPTPGSGCSDATEAASEGDRGEQDDADDACGVVEPDACGDGLVVCSTAGGWFCADLFAHDEHCGACFHDCGAYGEATCHDGECHCEGGPWMRRCGDGCTDTRSDAKGCGIQCLDCTMVHGAGARCEAGVCMPGWGR